MPSINNKPVVDRHNRPAVIAPVMLRTFFVNDGEYQAPMEISSVHIFERSQNLSPNTVLDSNGLISPAMSNQAKMVFRNRNELQEPVTQTDDPAFYESKYKQDATSSGIYSLSGGAFACVLDGVLGTTLSGYTDTGAEIQNTADLAIRYIDVWTVKRGTDSAWQTYINGFELFDDTSFTITEPLLLRSNHRLFNRKVTLGSKTDLKIGTEITIGNKDIDDSIKNIFKQSVVTSALIEIQKVNEDPNLPGRVTVVSSTDVNITAGNTIIYTFDTNKCLSEGCFYPLAVEEEEAQRIWPPEPGEEPSEPDSEVDQSFRDSIGTRSGTYALRVTYNLLHEKIVSDFMYFILH